MNYEQLTEIAQREGLVRWDKSGAVDYTRLTKSGIILVRRIKMAGWRPIPWQEAYSCREIQRSKVTV